MAFFLVITIGLTALIVTPGWLFYFDVTPKIAVLLAGAAGGAALSGRKTAPLQSRLGKRLHSIPSRDREGAVLAPAAGFQTAGLPAPLFFYLTIAGLLSLAISTALSENPALSAFGTNWRRFGAVTQAGVLLFGWSIARHTAGDPERIRIILRGVSLAATIAAAYGAAQYFGWDPILPAAAYQVGEGVWSIVRPPGTLGYASYFAGWLVIAAFLSMALLPIEKSTSWRRVAIASAGLASVAIFFTGTRAAILGLAAGALVLLYYRGFRVSRRMAAGVLLLATTGAAFYFSPAGWKLRSRSRWFAEDPWGGARMLLWRDSLHMSVDRLTLGYGPEVFTAAFPRYQSKELARAYPDFVHESPHNIFLDALISQGIPGLLLTLAFCAVGLRAALRGGNPWLAAALAGGIVSQQFTVFTAPTAMLFFTALGLAGGLSRAAAPSRLNLLFAPVGLVLLYCALRYTIADHALALAQRSVHSEDAAAAAFHYERYTRRRFPGSSADLWYSRALMDLAQKTSDPAARLKCLIQASGPGVAAPHTVEDPMRAWYSLAAIYASRNDLPGTETSLRSAIAAHPNWFKSHWMLAQLLRLDSRLEESEREAILAVDLNGGKNAEVVRTLEEVRAQRVR